MSRYAITSYVETLAAIFHPGMGEWVNYQVQGVSDNADEQTAQVISLMRGYVNADYQSPAVAQRAQECLETGNGDPIQGVFDHVRGRIAFTLDEITAQPLYPLLVGQDKEAVEVLVRPVDMASMEGRHLGDCDDFAMYTAALLMNLGIPCSFVTIAADQDYPEQFSHVYVAAYPEGQGRVAMDTSHGSGPGWESPYAYRKEEWTVKGMWGMGNGGGWAVLGLVLAGMWAMGNGKGRN